MSNEKLPYHTSLFYVFILSLSSISLFYLSLPSLSLFYLIWRHFCYIFLIMGVPFHHVGAFLLRFLHGRGLFWACRPPSLLRIFLRAPMSISLLSYLPSYCTMLNSPVHAPSSPPYLPLLVSCLLTSSHTILNVATSNDINPYI